VILTLCYVFCSDIEKEIQGLKVRQAARLDYQSAKELNRQRAELERESQKLKAHKARSREIIKIANAENQALNARLKEQLSRSDVIALSAAYDAMLKEALAAVKDRDEAFQRLCGSKSNQVKSHNLRLIAH
jgi:hypothetical protein